MNSPDQPDTGNTDDLYTGPSIPPAPGSVKIMHIRGAEDISVIEMKGADEASAEVSATIPLANLEEARHYLERCQQSTHFRSKIQVLLAQLPPQDETEIREFLRHVRDMSQRPYIVVSANSVSPVSRDITDDSILFDVADPVSTVRAVLPRAQEHWETYGRQEEVELEPFKTAKFSPLPALRVSHLDPERDCYDPLLSRIESVYWVATVDFDRTLYRPNSPTIMLHNFARFMRTRMTEFDSGCGNPEALEELIQYCDEWEDELKLLEQGRQIRDPFTRQPRKPTKYEDAIRKTGTLSAAAFEGMNIQDLRRYGKEFVATDLGGEFYPYSPAVLRKLKDHGVLPVLVTGLPDFLLPSILKKIGMTHGNGMTYQMDANGRLTGKIITNLGLAAEKAKHGERLIERGYAIALAIGDSVGDMGQFRCSVGRSRAKWDVNGSAVLVNADDQAVEETERHYTNEIASGRVHIVDKNRPPEAVTAAVGLALRSVFEPMHRYGELQRADQAWELLRFVGDLEEKCNSNTLLPFTENLKRIRDALEREGLSKPEIQGIMERFYPSVLVDLVLKRHVINTRVPSDLRDHLERIGINRDSIEQILKLNAVYHGKHTSGAPRKWSPSSHPPASSPPDEDE